MTKQDVCFLVDCSEGMQEFRTAMTNAVVNLTGMMKNHPFFSYREIFLTLIPFSDSFSATYDCVPLRDVSPYGLSLKYGGRSDPAPALRHTADMLERRFRIWTEDRETDVFLPMILFLSNGEFAEEHYPAYKTEAERLRSIRGLFPAGIFGVSFGDPVNGQYLDKLPLSSRFTVDTADYASIAKLRKHFRKSMEGVEYFDPALHAPDNVRKIGFMFRNFTET